MDRDHDERAGERRGDREHNERATDRGWLARASALSLRYHWITSALVFVATLWLTFFLSLGYSFATPQKRFEALAADLADMKLHRDQDKAWADSAFKVVARRDDTRTEQLTYLQHLIEASVVVQCLVIPKGNTQAAGLPCFRLLNERGIQ